MTFTPSRNQTDAVRSAFAPQEVTKDSEMLGAVLSQITPYGELDPERQKYAGQRKVAGSVAIDFSGVDRALKTGDPQLLEAIDFGSSADGEPFLHFIDQQGNSQYVNVTGPQWMSLITQRSQAREELKFRRNAEVEREALGQQWRQLTNASQLPSSEKKYLDLLFQMSPSTAMQSFKSAVTQRRVAEEKERMFGLGEAVGGPASEEWVRSEVKRISNGALVLPEGFTASRVIWDKVISLIVEDATNNPDQPLRVLRGKPATAAAYTAAVATDMARYNSADKQFASMASSLDRQRMADQRLDPESRSYYNRGYYALAEVQTLIRGAHESYLPDMSFYDAMELRGAKTWTQQSHFIEQVLRVIQILDPAGFKLPDIELFSKSKDDRGRDQFEVTEEDMAILRDTFAVIDRFVSGSLGWLPMGPNDHNRLAIPILQAISRLDTRKTEYVPVTTRPPEVSLSDDASGGSAAHELVRRWPDLAPLIESGRSLAHIIRKAQEDGFHEDQDFRRLLSEIADSQNQKRQ